MLELYSFYQMVVNSGPSKVPAELFMTLGHPEVEQMVITSK